jgi:transposase
MADPINTSTPTTLIALDIAKKHHAAKILYPSGRAVHLRITNTLDGFERLVEIADSPVDRIRVGFEPTADYHRNIAHWLLTQGVQCHLVSSLACARAREMLFKTWCKPPCFSASSY